MGQSASRCPFDAILFDLDGTLADTAEDIRRSLRAAFGAIGIDVADRVAALVDGSPLEEVFAVAAPHGDPATFARFVAAYRADYARADVFAARLFPGVRDTLETFAALRPRVRLAVATSKREAAAHAVLTTLEAAHYFEVVAGSGGTAIPPKPAPDLLLAVTSRLAVAPARTLMVGDTLRDVVAGRRAGMRTAAVTYGMGTPEALARAHPDYLLEEFDDLLALLGPDA